MNSTWNKNLQLFTQRFPQLANLIQKEIKTFSNLAGTEAQPALHNFWQVSQAKNGWFIPQEGNLKLHSAYNPEREAVSAISIEKEKLEAAQAAVFLGFGFGYSVLELCRQKPFFPVILIEPDISCFLTALLYTDWEPVFKNPNFIIALSSTPEQTSILLNQHSLLETVFFTNKAHTAHAQEYFNVINTLIQRNIEKEKINSATLKKFGKLWHTNCKRNAKIYDTLSGVSEFENTITDKPFVVLAAGPTLQEILPHLKQIKEKARLVCVDTALKACLRVNVEPDFIVLTDPQYWAYRHIAGLKSPSSTLITELAVYPAVFRFKCKKIIVCDSKVPMGKEYSSLAQKKGDLGSGGSVASVALNFAVLCGAKEIWVAGLDFSFPDRQTHIKGSTFEEAVHTHSSKISTAVTSSMPLLFSGNACLSTNYDNQPLVTDQRMKMFAWWFESRIAQLPDVKVYNFSAKGLKIPGIIPSTLDSFFQK